MTKRETNKQLDPLTLHELTRVLPRVMGGPLFSPIKTEIIAIEYIRHEGPTIGWQAPSWPEEHGEPIYDDSQSLGEYMVTLQHDCRTQERIYLKCAYLREVLTCPPARLVCHNTLRSSKGDS